MTTTIVTRAGPDDKAPINAVRIRVKAAVNALCYMVLEF